MHELMNEITNLMGANLTEDDDQVEEPNESSPRVLGFKAGERAITACPYKLGSLDPKERFSVNEWFEGFVLAVLRERKRRKGN